MRNEIEKWKNNFFYRKNSFVLLYVDVYIFLFSGKMKIHSNNEDSYMKNEIEKWNNDFFYRKNCFILLYVDIYFYSAEKWKFIVIMKTPIWKMKAKNENDFFYRKNSFVLLYVVVWNNFAYRRNHFFIFRFHFSYGSLHYYYVVSFFHWIEIYISTYSSMKQFFL